MIGRKQNSDISIILIGYYVSFIVIAEALKNLGRQLCSDLFYFLHLGFPEADSAPDVASLSQGRHWLKAPCQWLPLSCFPGIEKFYCQGFWSSREIENHSPRKFVCRTKQEFQSDKPE